MGQDLVNMEHVWALVFVFWLKTGRFFGTILAHSFLIFIFVAGICLIVSLSIYDCIVILMPKQFSVLTGVLISSTFSSVFVITRQPHCLSSSTLFLSSEKLLCHSNTWALDKGFSLYSSCNRLDVSGAVFFSFVRNFMLTCGLIFLIKHDHGKLKKLLVKNYYWKLFQRNRAWFGIWPGEGSLVTNIYLFLWSLVEIRLCVQSHYLIATVHTFVWW